MLFHSPNREEVYQKAIELGPDKSHSDSWDHSRGHRVGLMSYTFNARIGPILVDAEISGPSGTLGYSFAGYRSNERVRSIPQSFVSRRMIPTIDRSTQMTTGIGVTTVPRIMLDRTCATATPDRHSVLAHDLPHATDVDGLLGLDFLRDQILTIDFRPGAIDLV